MSLGRHAGRGPAPRQYLPSRLLQCSGQGAGAGREAMARVHRWGVEEVVDWVAAAGFQEICPAVRECGVDGDILLLLSDHDCQADLGMANGLLRKRFLRELAGLRRDADYSSCGGEELATFLGRIGPEFRGYTYHLLSRDISLDFLSGLEPGAADLQELLREAGVSNSVHRHRMVEALDCLQDELMSDSGLQSDPDIPETQYDVYLTHPRGKGEELASLIQLQLEMKGFSVYADSHVPGCLMERSLSLVEGTRNFLLVLPPGALDTLEEDERFHAELAAALYAEPQPNIVPVTDNFQWPDPDSLPEDVRAVGYFNSVRWVHDYQDACILKIERFLRGDSSFPLSGTRSPVPGARTPLPSGHSTPGGLWLRPGIPSGCSPGVRTSGRRVSEQRLMPHAAGLQLPRRGKGMHTSRSCASLLSLE